MVYCIDWVIINESRIRDESHHRRSSCNTHYRFYPGNLCLYSAFLEITISSPRLTVHIKGEPRALQRLVELFRLFFRNTLDFLQDFDRGVLQALSHA